jgi:hypothetical protein
MNTNLVVEKSVIIKKNLIETEDVTSTILGLLLFGLLALLLVTFVSHYPPAYAIAQREDKITSVSQSISSPNQLISPEGSASTSQLETPTGFVAKGTIDSLINVPNGKWIAVGNWSLILNNGVVTYFGTNMTWHDSNGTTAHTHELAGFHPAFGEQVVSVLQPNNNSIVLKGITDAGTNNRISWTGVPATIFINGRNVIAISVDDNMTNHHFAGQPVFGIVRSFVPCSDLPGPNMEVLPPCSVDRSQISSSPLASPSGSSSILPLQNQTASSGIIPGSENAPGLEQQSEDAPGLEQQSEDAPGLEQQSEDAPGLEQQSEDAPGLKLSSAPSASGQTDKESSSGASLAKTTSSIEEQVTGTVAPGGQDVCERVEIMNITANSFENDTADYHPARDAIDGNSSTWWSNQGENSWLKIDLGRDNSLCEVQVEWNKGDERKYTFEISASKDGNDFAKVLDGTNKQGSTDVESYKIDDGGGRYITLTVTDSSSDKGWVSIKEISIIGRPAA